MKYLRQERDVWQRRWDIGQRTYIQNRMTPLLLLVAIMLLAVLLSALTSYFVGSQQRVRFEREAANFDSALLRRLETYQKVLVATRALWSAERGINQATFHNYTQDLNLPEYLPGALGLGFAQWVTPAGQSAFEARMRREYPAYRVHPPVTGSGGTPITYLEPPIPVNRSSLGYDMYSSPARRTVMQRAYQTKQPTMTAPLILVQDQRLKLPQPSVLIYLPVMRSGDLYGYVYMPVRFAELLTSLLAEQPVSGSGQGERLNIQVFDGTERLYGQDVAHAAFRSVSTLKLAGRTWQVHYSASENFGRDWAVVLPGLVLFLGTVVALAAYFSYLAQTRALESAEEVSESLRLSRSKLERSRAEFESILRAMSDTAIFTDQSGRVLFANDALQRQFGYLPQELRGQNITLLRGDSRLYTNGTSGELERLTTLYTRRDQKQFYGEMQRNKVMSRGGEMLGYLEVIHDISGRLSTERALKVSEQRYHSVLEALASPLWVMTPNGTVTYQNLQYRLLFAQENLADIVHPDNQELYHQQWEHSRQDLQAFRSELRLKTQTGYRYFLVFGSPLFAPSSGGKKVLEWVFSAGDIHDRRQAEQKARQNEQRYREVLEGMPQIVWMTDAAGQPIYFNQRWYDYVGQTDTPGDVLALLHPDDRQEFAFRWREALATGHFFEMEHRLRGETGYHTFMTRGVNICGPQDEVVEWVVTSTDIDDQVYAEWSSRLLAQLSKQLSSEYLSAEYLSDRGDYLVSGNLRAALNLINERLTVLAALWVQGGQAQQGAQQRLTSSMSQARGHVREGALLSNPQVRAAAARAAYLTEPVVVEDASLLTGGVSGLVLLLLSPGREEGENSTYLALGFRQAIQVRDLEVVQEVASRLASALESLRLSQQVQVAQHALQDLNASLEERVQQRTLELAETNQELEAFSYSVSHDLRTPLRHIIAFGDLLGKDGETVLSKKGGRYLGIMTDAARRMNQLIDDLLEFSRTSRQPLNLGRMPIEQLTREVVAELQLTSPGNAAQWHIDPLPDVLGDPSLLRQVLVNLLGNAAKYSARNPHPEIWITATREGREVVFTVRDNGVGFDPQYADKLFGVFQRLHRPEDFEGSGIGLANVRRIVVRHGGRVGASGRLGEGASFFFSLRLYEEPAQAAPLALPSSSPSSPTSH